MIAAVVANSLYLFGVVAADPVYRYSDVSNITKAALLPGYNFIDPNVGFTAQALGHLAAHDWFHLQFPWWNPFEGLGQPLVGEMQSAALFPLTILDLAPDGQVWFRFILEVTAGLSTLFLLRRLVTSQWVAVAGAVVFECNGLFAWMFHAPGNPVAFAPMLLLGIEQAGDENPRGLAGWPLIAIALALSIYAGFPEVAYIDSLLAVVWALVRLSQRRNRDFLHYAGKLAAGVVAGLMLSAPVLVAFLVFETNGDVGGHSGAGFSDIALSSALHLPALIMPYTYGPIFGWIGSDPKGLISIFWSNAGGYLGASLLILGVASLAGSRERALRLALAAWTAISISRSYGLPLAMHLLALIPGEKQSAYFRYASPSWTLALVVLAALYLDDLAVDRTSLLRRIAPVLASASVFCLAAVWLYNRSSEVHRTLTPVAHQRVWLDASLAFAVLIAVGCILGSALKYPPRRIAFLGGLMALEALCFFVVPQLSTPRGASLDLAPVDYLREHLGTYRFFTMGPIQPDYGSYWYIASLSINDVPISKSFSEYITENLDDNVVPNVFTGATQQSATGPSPMQEFINHFRSYEQSGVKYLVLPPKTPVPVIPGIAPLHIVFSDFTAEIVQLPSPRPMFTSDEPTCIRVSSNIDAADFRCTKSAVVKRLEQWMPGWTATDDGKHVPITPIDHVFQSVTVHPGTNVLSFSYRPPHARLAELGFAVSMLTLLGAVGLRERRLRLPGSKWEST